MHFAVIVISENENLSDMMAPYDFNDDRFFRKVKGRLGSFNPNYEWDWYVLGGGWKGSLVHKEECRYPSDIGHGDSFNDDGTCPPRSCDQVRKCDLDLKTTLKTLKVYAWLDCGGWTAVENDKKSRAMIKKKLKSLPDDALVSIVDCHI